MKTIAIVAGGNLSRTFLPQIMKSQIKIGADRGAWWLLNSGIFPDYAIGDFDSVSPEELLKIKHNSPNVVQYKTEKDETDLELAINLAVSLKPSSILVFGGIGSRLDQTLAGIYILEKLHTIDITFFDKSNEVSIVTTEKKLRKLKKFPYCSFLPITQTATVTLEGFKYPLIKGVLERIKTLGISNEIVAPEAKIIVHEGKVLCMRTRG